MPVIVFNEEEEARKRDARDPEQVYFATEDAMNRILADLRWLNVDGRMRSRRRSLAITSLEESMHWLGMETGG